MWKIFLILFVLLAWADAQDPFADVRVNSIDLAYPSGGAIEHSKMVLDEIGSNPDYAKMLVVKPSGLKSRAYGSHSPTGWMAYTAQDAKTSWMGEGMAAYSLWS